MTLIVINIKDIDCDKDLNEVLDRIREHNEKGLTRGHNTHGSWFIDFFGDEGMTIPTYRALENPSLHNLRWSTATTRNKARDMLKKSWYFWADIGFTIFVLAITIIAIIYDWSFWCVALGGFFTGANFCLVTTKFAHPEITHEGQRT